MQKPFFYKDQPTEIKAIVNIDYKHYATKKEAKKMYVNGGKKVALIFEDTFNLKELQENAENLFREDCVYYFSDEKIFKMREYE